MRILGVDPGSLLTGYGIIDFDNNEKEIIGGLLYRIDLLDPLPEASAETGSIEDNSFIYDRFVSTEQFSMQPNEKKDFSFNYNPPALPAGNYRLQITATNKLGRDMGWWDADIKLQNSNSSFLKLISGPLISPEYPDRHFPSQAGPNISPNANFAIHVVAINPNDQPITVTPALYLYEFDIARGLLSKTRGDEITIPGKSTKKIIFPVTASNLPRVYYSLLALEDPHNENRFSNLNEYRWVVKGEHAEIVAVRINNFSNKGGQEVSARVDLIGPADAITKSKISLTVFVRDKNGIAGSIETEPTELTDGLVTTQGPIILSRDLQEKSELVAILKNKNNEIVNQYSIPLDTFFPLASPVTVNATPNNILRNILIGIAILITLTFIIYLLKQNLLGKKDI